MISDKNSKICITAFERRTNNNSEQLGYYSEPSVITNLQNSGNRDLLDAHTRKFFKNQAISFSLNTSITEHNTNLYYFVKGQNSSAIESIFNLKTPSPSGLLVPGLISYTNNVLIFELPPTYKMVSHVPVNKDSINDEILSQYKVDSYIPIPWQVYIAIFNNENRLIDTYMYYSRNSIISAGVDEPLYSPALPNFYSNGMLCRPFYSSMDDVEKYTQDLSGIFSAAYDSVWNSGWNADLLDSILDISAHVYFPTHKAKSSQFKHCKQYFESQEKVQIFEDYYKKLSLIPSSSRHKSFSHYVNSILNFSLEDVLNSIFATPSAHQIWEQDFEHLRENLVEQFLEDNDSEYYNEDDLSAYIDEGVSVLKYQLKSFQQVVSNVLKISSSHNLYQLSSGSYKTNYKFLFDNLIRY